MTQSQLHMSLGSLTAQGTHHWTIQTTASVVERRHGNVYVFPISELNENISKTPACMKSGSASFRASPLEPPLHTVGSWINSLPDPVTSTFYSANFNPSKNSTFTFYKVTQNDREDRATFLHSHRVQKPRDSEVEKCILKKIPLFRFCQVTSIYISLYLDAGM